MRSWHGKPIRMRLMIAIAMTIASLLLGCDDDDDFEEGIDISDIENRTFNFADGRAFGLPDQQVTLEVGMFGEPGLEDDEASYTLTSGNFMSQGTIELDQSIPIIEDNPLGEDFAGCNFDNQISDFVVEELRQGETLETNCDISDDQTQLRIEHDGQVSTGDFAE
jgi:hypothetical protein